MPEGGPISPRLRRFWRRHQADQLRTRAGAPSDRSTLMALCAFVRTLSGQTAWTVQSTLEFLGKGAVDEQVDPLASRSSSPTWRTRESTGPSAPAGRHHRHRASLRCRAVATAGRHRRLRGGAGKLAAYFLGAGQTIPCAHQLRADLHSLSRPRCTKASCDSKEAQRRAAAWARPEKHLRRRGRRSPQPELHGGARRVARSSAPVPSGRAQRCRSCSRMRTECRAWPQMRRHRCSPGRHQGTHDARREPARWLSPVLGLISQRQAGCSRSWVGGADGTRTRS